MENGSTNIDTLLKKASETKLRKFLRQRLMADEVLLRDFEIFLQGAKTTQKTVESYRERVMSQLDDLDMDDLEQVWLSMGDDFYDFYPNYRDDNEYDDQTLTNILQPFQEEAWKYAENGNFGESEKIYWALLEALGEKSSEAKDSNPDVTDWFLQEMRGIVATYAEVIGHIPNTELKQFGLDYLCELLRRPENTNLRANVAHGLGVAATHPSDAEFCLEQLPDLRKKKELLPYESSLLTHLYALNSDEELFETVSLAHLQENLSLTMNLLHWYER